jgi:hypothetical protein
MKPFFLTALTMLAVSATSSVAAPLPSRFLGRWEQKQIDCRTPSDLRDDGGILNIKSKKLEWYEGEAKYLSIRILSDRKISIKILANDADEMRKSFINLEISASGRNLRADGWENGRYLRCNDTK